MVCDTLVYHPTVTRLIKYLDTTAGREKALRLLQYLCRFIAANQMSALAKGLQTQFTIVRKILRFLKPLNHLQAASKLYDNRLSGDNIIRLGNVIKNLAYAGYLTFDQVNLLRILQIVPVTQFTGKQVPKLANWFWFLGLASGLVIDVRNIHTSQGKLLAIASKSADGEDSSTEKYSEDVKAAYVAACKQRYSAVRRLVWDSFDTFIVLNNLGYLSSSEESIGLAGVVTSLLGLEDLWKATQ
ncbi:Peroxisomal membrane protein PMP27 [Nakaseomyces bracarensis]|uniref:Peroxisomal membrane protein PMP27 n=1 Tax=Nakaseomyces bracarensis TaxID=273131 RepID=A0ABR4NWK5_9SACH